MLLFQEAVVENSLLCAENIYVLENAIHEIRHGELHGYTPCPVLQLFALLLKEKKTEQVVSLTKLW